MFKFSKYYCNYILYTRIQSKIKLIKHSQEWNDGEQKSINGVFFYSLILDDYMINKNNNGFC